jgi:hypothetical protein
MLIPNIPDIKKNSAENALKPRQKPVVVRAKSPVKITVSKKQCSMLVTSLSPARVSRFKEIYNNAPDVVDYLIQFGSPLERAQNEIIKEVALSA